MRNLTTDEAKEWIYRNGYSYEAGEISLSGSDTAITERVAIPNDVYQLSKLIRVLAMLDGFEGQRVLWITEWNIWSTPEDGLRHLSRLTSRSMRSPEEPDFHCYLFDQREWEDLLPLLCVPFLYAWDAYLLAEGCAALIRITHESRVSASIPTRSPIDRRFLRDIVSLTSPTA